MKKVLALVLVVGMMLLSVPAFAVLDDNSTNYSAENTNVGINKNVGVNKNFGVNKSVNVNENKANSDARSASFSASSAKSNQKQGQAQGQGQIAAQGQGQLGIVSPEQSSEVNVGGDTQKNTMYYMSAPSTVAGKDQQASSIYSIFGGVNLATTQEYVVCREKMDVIENLKKGGYLTEAEAKDEMATAWKQFKDNTQEKRFLWIGPKTRGTNLGNLGGWLAMDSCNEFNSDNWFGTKDLITKKKSK